MQRRNFIQALAFSSVLATGIVKAKALPIGKQLTNEEINSAIAQISSSSRSTTIRVGGEGGLKNFDQLNDWMRNNTWDKLEIIVSITSSEFTLKEYLDWVPKDLVERNIQVVFTWQTAPAFVFNQEFVFNSDSGIKNTGTIIM